jgi:hypothetical protein
MTSYGQTHPHPHEVGLGLHCGVLDDRHATAERVAHPAGPLLDHVREFVSDEP